MKKELKNIKENLKKKLNKKGLVGNVYRRYSATKYQLKVEKKSFVEALQLDDSRLIKEAVKLIKETDKDYIVLYNPEWLGVANSTKGLFESNIPIKRFSKKSNRKRVINAITSKQIKNVILSQVLDGWIEFIKELYQKDNEIKIKVLWHGNVFETGSDYTWEFNKKVIELLDEKILVSIAFVKMTTAKLYEARGFKTFDFLNKVTIDKSKLGEKKKTNKDFLKDEIKVGIYNAHSREIKNIYTQILAMSFFENAVVDIVPSSKNVCEYAEKLNIRYTKVDKFIPTAELMRRIQQNDINLYATFAECSPMVPIESFEAGIPCVMGNNNDYFLGSELRDYVTVDAEDDPEAIYNKLVYCLENKEKVLKLYEDWKKQFKIDVKAQVEEFIDSK